MGKLTELPTKRVLAALKKTGWIQTSRRRSGGKHTKLIHPTKPGALTVPRANLLRAGVLRAIIRQAGLTPDQFWELYK